VLEQGEGRPQHRLVQLIAGATVFDAAAYFVKATDRISFAVANLYTDATTIEKTGISAGTLIKIGDIIHIYRAQGLPISFDQKQYAHTVKARMLVMIEFGNLDVVGLQKSGQKALGSVVKRLKIKMTDRELNEIAYLMDLANREELFIIFGVVEISGNGSKPVPGQLQGELIDAQEDPS